MHGISDEDILQARRHYTQAEVDGCTLYKLYDDAHVKVSSNMFFHNELDYLYTLNV